MCSFASCNMLPIWVIIFWGNEQCEVKEWLWTNEKETRTIPPGSLFTLKNEGHMVVLPGE